MAPSVVFLVDVDNTLLDNDRFRQDVREHFAQELGEATRDLYWEIQEQLFVDLGYRDYLGALQRTWLESGRDMRVTALSSYLLDYPFAERLYPGALEVLGPLPRVGHDGRADGRRVGLPAAQARPGRDHRGRRR